MPAPAYRVAVDDDRRLEIELPPEPPDLEDAAQARRAGVRNGLWIVGILTLLAVGWLAYPTLLPIAFSVSFALLGLVPALWLNLRVAHLAASTQPSRIVVTSRRLSLRLGRGGLAVRRTFPLKQVRSLGYITTPHQQTGSLPPRANLVVRGWDFTTTSLATTLTPSDAEALGRLLRDRMRGHLSTSGVLDEQLPGFARLDGALGNLADLDRPPPGSHAEVTWGEKGELVVEVPARPDYTHPVGGRRNMTLVVAGLCLFFWFVFAWFQLWQGGGIFVPIFVTLVCGFAVWRLRADPMHRMRFEVGQDRLTVLHSTLRPNHRDVVRLADLDSLELNSAHEQNWLEMRVDRRRKLKLLSGHPKPVLTWLTLLLRTATGLEDRDAAEAEAEAQTDNVSS